MRLNEMRTKRKDPEVTFDSDPSNDTAKANKQWTN